MKNILIITLFLSLFSFTVCAQDTGIVFFSGSWEEALVKAEKENKLIFLDSYTSWCAPCKRLAKEVFVQKKVGDSFNSKFINVTMDMEKGVGKELCKKYGITSFPTLLIINSKGYKKDQLIGFWEADALISWADKAINKKDVVLADERFDQEDWSDDFISTYFADLIKTSQIAKARISFNRIIKTKGYALLYKKTYWDLLEMLDIDSPAAIYFAQNRNSFYNVYGEDVVNAKLRRMYVSIRPLSKIYPSDLPRRYINEEYLSLLAKMKERNLPDQDFMKSEIDFYLKCRSGRSDEAYTEMNKQLTNAPFWKLFDASIMANWALQSSRKQAAKWAEQATTLAKTEAERNKALEISKQLETQSGAYTDIPTTEVLGRKLFGL